MPKNPIFAFMKKIKPFLLPLWLLIIVILTAMPGKPGLEKFSSSTFRWDYLEHFSFYFLIPIIYYLANWNPYHSKNMQKSFILIFSGILFATITEVYQIWIPGRAFNPVDLILNNTGFILGIPVGRVVRNYLRRVGGK